MIAPLRFFGQINFNRSNRYGSIFLWGVQVHYTIYHENVVVGMKNTGNGGSIIVGMSSEAKHHGMSFGDDNKVNLEPIILKNKNTGEDVKVTCDWGLALGRSLTVTGIYGIAIGQYSQVHISV